MLHVYLVQALEEKRSLFMCFCFLSLLLFRTVFLPVANSPYYYNSRRTNNAADFKKSTTDQPLLISNLAPVAFNDKHVDVIWKVLPEHKVFIKENVFRLKR